MPRDARRRNAPQRPLADRVTFGSGNQQDHNQFTFESSRQGPQFPPAQAQNDAPSHPRKKHKKPNRKGRGGNTGEARDAPQPSQPANDRSANPSRRNDNRTHGWGPGNRDQDGQGRGGGYRRTFRRFPATHERALLQDRGSTGPERTLGVVDGVNKFLNLDDLSAGEEEMDLDDGRPAASESSTSSSEEPHKVAKVAGVNSANGDSVPKWSNPDPYTALPPPAAREKKFDPVALIRKAKNEQASSSSSKPAATDDDFISFDNEDDDMRPPPQAPRGPRSQGGLYGDGNQVAGSLNDIMNAPGSVLAPERLTRSGKQIAYADAADLPLRSQHAPGLPTNRPQDRPTIPQGNKRKRGEFEGGIVGDWLPVTYLSPTPWLRNGKCPVPQSVIDRDCPEFEKMTML
jgi:non-canonical poly(A) RNA polymerase PAPD5/7